MPIYEYQCQKCGTFEVTQRITEKALSKCPTCRGKVKKLISSTSFQLKGTGWYLTDYARKGNGAAKTTNGSKNASETKPSTTEAKKDSPSSKSDTSSTSTSTS
jgi:putative FmdB family regulatory protein